MMGILTSLDGKTSFILALKHFEIGYFDFHIFHFDTILSICIGF